MESVGESNGEVDVFKDANGEEGARGTSSQSRADFVEFIEPKKRDRPEARMFNDVAWFLPIERYFLMFNIKEELRR